MGQLLRMEDVASRLGISYHQARTIIVVDDKIPYIKVGARGIRIQEEDLDKYIKSLEVENVAGTTE